ncbi:MAG: redox-regulated ATPase YchF [Candidatus Obscuribacter sp.]|nr:redox-regulated ATPase YchF [Candidatus Obscuribacter sp.]MBK7839667.1 redox-regulated ATPase YchF [Candidatus Obscuribacter sp.]MBK9202371.1 redox-regulated ATPase YchF [Candidatus Obscuribacter sp.]MBK9618837.1 redox-regulated ATPase YchF [Candidatus Obscuribacter sp.]MBL0184348.1 redox-regulated ATPase YchF [Candidatus Obscuribacter sp.]
MHTDESQEDVVLKAGIVGLPNVGKSTLFNALTASYQAESANYPFCTIEPNVGIVKVPDARLEKLKDLVNPQAVLPAAFEFVDIAGLVRGASKGEGLGNQFLSHIREVDAVVHVVRCFEDENITHVDGQVDPIRDADTIHIELAMADQSSITKRMERLNKQKKQGDKRALLELSIMEKILPFISEVETIDMAVLTDEEIEILPQLQLLSTKPLLYAANVMESELANPDANKFVKALKERAKEEGRPVVIISAQIEAELSALDAEERSSYLDSLGVKDSGVNTLIRAAFDLLGLKTYFTAGEKEVRAWPFESGFTAPKCAGIIHTDFERGFIKAEVIGYKDYVTSGSEKTAREKGLLRLEGKEYVMNDGDVVHFRFNV